MALELTNVSKRIGNTWALRDVSLRAEPGRILGIFGPNGSGKSMLLKVIAGTEGTNGGTITGRGDEKPLLVAPTAYRSGIKAIFTRPKPASDGEAALDELSEITNGAATLVLLDNAFACLDGPQRSRAFEKIRAAAAERSLSVIFASSDFTEILEFCDEAVVLTRGDVIQTGTPQGIYDDPATAMIADITGPNNLIEARRLSSSKADIPEFQTIEGEHRLVAQKIARGMLGALNRNVTLGIRPEQIMISFGASFPEDNLLKASIKAIKPLGAATRVELDSNGLRLTAMVTRLIGLNIDDECMLGLPPDRIRIFRD